MRAPAKGVPDEHRDAMSSRGVSGHSDSQSFAPTSANGWFAKKLKPKESESVKVALISAVLQGDTRSPGGII